MRRVIFKAINDLIPKRVLQGNHDKKVFVIGFNKTGTSSFYKLFCLNRLASQHSTSWNLDKYQCFSDGGSYHNFEKLYARYPDSLFILNTRSLEDWLISRFLHGCRFSAKWANPVGKDLIEQWVTHRRKYQRRVLEWFSKYPEQLCVVSIDDPGWAFLVADFCKLPRVRNVHSFKTPHLVDKVWVVREVHEALDFLQIPKAERREQLFPGHQNLLLRFRHNIT
jgi:hypothetical protein